MRYTVGEIEKGLGSKRIECDPIKLSELRNLLENGWVIYDTQTTHDPCLKILTLAKVSDQ